MTRTATWLFTLILAFVFGATATLLSVKSDFFDNRNSETLRNFDLVYDENVSANLPILSYCELANNPEKYDGKIVRLSVTRTYGTEGSWFSDKNCAKSDNAAYPTWKDKNIWNTVRKTGEGNDKYIPIKESNLIVIGKFKNSVYKDCCYIMPFQFEVLKVEKESNTIY